MRPTGDGAKGDGLYAKKYLNKGTVVAQFLKPNVMNKKGYEKKFTGLSDDTYIYSSPSNKVHYDESFTDQNEPPYWYKMNHSDNPNTKVIYDRKQKLIRWEVIDYVPEGNELTFKYDNVPPEWNSPGPSSSSQSSTSKSSSGRPRRGASSKQISELTEDEIHAQSELDVELNEFPEGQRYRNCIRCRRALTPEDEYERVYSKKDITKFNTNRLDTRIGALCEQCEEELSQKKGIEYLEQYQLVTQAFVDADELYGTLEQVLVNISRGYVKDKKNLSGEAATAYRSVDYSENYADRADAVISILQTFGDSSDIIRQIEGYDDIVKIPLRNTVRDEEEEDNLMF